MILVHALALALASTANPPGEAVVPPVFSEVHGAFFAVSVADIDSSIDWYREKLGLSLIMRFPPNQGAAAAVLRGHGLTVELIHHDGAMPLSRAAPQLDRDYLIHGIFKAGLTVDDLEATRRMLEQRGVEIAIGPFPARPGQPANFIIRDNSGNFIQFFGR